MKNAKARLFGVVSSLAIAGSVLFGLGGTAYATNACSVVPTPLGKWGESFVIKNGNVTATFTVVGSNCSMPVTLTAWKTDGPNGGSSIYTQKLYSHATQVFKPGVHTLVTTVPDCYFQVDIVEGANPYAPDGTPAYDYQNGQIIDGGLRDFKYGGDKKCVVPKPTPHPKPTPKPTPTPTPTPTTPQVLPAATTTPAATTLPNTGVSLYTVLGISALFSLVAGVAHSVFKRRFARGNR